MLFFLVTNGIKSIGRINSLLNQHELKNIFV